MRTKDKPGEMQARLMPKLVFVIVLFSLVPCCQNESKSRNYAPRHAPNSVTRTQESNDIERSKRLFAAISQNDRSAINIILSSKRSLANGVRQNNNLPLVFAAMNDSVKPDIVKLLLSYGADPDKRQDSLGLAFGHVFAITNSSTGSDMNRQVEKFKILAPVTKDKSEIREMMREFFHHQRFGQYDNAMRSLFDYVFASNLLNVNDRLTNSGLTLLMEAASSELPQTVNYLVNKGADITLTDKSGKNALEYGLTTVPSIYDSVDDRTIWRCQEYKTTGHVLIKLYHVALNDKNAKALIASMLENPDLASGCFNEAYELISVFKINYLKESSPDLGHKAQALSDKVKKAKVQKLAQLLSSTHL